MGISDLAIRGGTVIDGTGAPPRRADVGIVGGRIAELAPRVRGVAEIDARGRLVVPGFIDVHTHYDAQVLWDPRLSPSSAQGVTSVVMGNCGFGLAPVRPPGRDLLLRTLETVEDMRLATLEAGVAWDFESYGDYLDAVERRRPLINVGGYVGHTPIRVYVMGEDAAERPASADELAQMVTLTRRSLREGALGFATDRAGFIAGAGGRPIPSAVATQLEVEALMRATAEERRGIVHIAAGEDYRWLFEFQRTLGRTINWSSILAYREGTTSRTPYHQRLAELAAGRAAGADVWAQVTCRPIRQVITLRDPAPLSTLRVFGEVFDRPPNERVAVYADHAWRARATTELATSSVPMRWDAIIVTESPTRPDSIGRAIGSFEAMCDLAVADDLDTRFDITFANDKPEAVSRLLRSDGCIIGTSDAGAHVTQICDAVVPTDFLAHWVRDRGVLPIEHGVHKLTGELAAVMGLDRGRVQVSRPADVVVLDLDALDPGPIRRVRDMPAGGERLSADEPRGIDAVIVNGVLAWRDGVPTGARPGAILRSSP